MGARIDIEVPDIGDFSDVPIIEIFVKPGDTIHADDALVTLESDKATMDVPAPTDGVIREVCVKPGDRVSKGSLLFRVETGPADGNALSVPEENRRPQDEKLPSAGPVHASPSVRAYARELGVDLRQVKPGNPKGRILREDVAAFVKGALTSASETDRPDNVAGGAAFDLLPWPKVDFARFGAIEIRPRSRIQKISAQNLARNWVMIPAVTYHEDADITSLEAFRVQLNKESSARDEKSGVKLTLLAFLIKASVKALQEFPEFNSSLDGETLILKKYFHIGFAADTPHGLVVPVIKDADRKSIRDIAQETSALAREAREGRLKPADMQGAGFTLSSLGGIGGTGFSPIINAPEVAILGINKAATKPVWDGSAFVPRLILPLSLTADHRVIDGALATRFTVFFAQLLADFRRVTL
jgi:pyruvate dehydrogenase E2 component (dihydrolipoamide acetyltransferase)